jgi:Rrf2 family cysteine metabolism transcriptional repressor
MIKLTTKGRYGTRLMLNLAQHYANGNVAVILKNISTEEDISIRYLEQIIIPLKINKLVKSIRGAGGGYTLSRPPSQITVCDILKALEGSCALVDCIEDEGYCDRLSTCASFEIWKEASNILKKYFESVTLQGLIEIAKKKQRKAKDKAKTKAH